MGIAANETIREDDVSREKAGGRPATEPPLIEGRKKPR